MEIVKKNILSVISGVIALIALIALVWPIGGMYEDQHTVLDGRIKVEKDVAGLIKAPRNWPVIPDLKSGEKPKLDRFPNEETINAGIDIKNQVHAQAMSIGTEIAKFNKHEPIFPGILPNPGDNRNQFQREYQQWVEDGKTRSKLFTAIYGTVPPTNEDIKAEADNLWNNGFKQQIVVVGNVQVNLPQVIDDWTKKCNELKPTMRLAAARKGKVYLEPGWLSVQKELLLPTNTAPKDPEIWFAQNMLWVQKDLIDSINQLNADAKGVEDATVKHIFQMDIPSDQSMYALPTAAGGPPPSATDVPVKVFTDTPTGRVCNPLYDVIHFQLVMNVDAAKIPLIITELQRNKLITVLWLDHAAVNGIESAEHGYIYGDVGVARVTIRGEELFLREWTVPLMPRTIIDLLQVPPAVVAQGK